MAPSTANIQEHLRNDLDIARNVIVQASCHGRDNTALLHALDYFGETARGVVAIGSDVSQSELADMHHRGVRGVRFNFVKRLVENQSLEEVELVAAKIRELGWHIVVYFESPDLPDLADFLANLDVPLIIDHLGRPDDAVLLNYLTQIAPDESDMQRQLVDNPMALYWGK
ncbi:amidohydrolase family protein [Enteractinococcus helveticum]|uniref:Amidohydrolase-related domain-containing protein n=1 Tax=Enteractinococcus helveticum TaxID=1837282 RepID=A0A1B7LUM9_9MICC|nr:amidohydrolase family protein [Enteractinococcus helveticum]OAV51153.1 hypothetical protein A6F49_02435 [Enteractinococcus helveticum]